MQAFFDIKDIIVIGGFVFTLLAWLMSFIFGNKRVILILVSTALLFIGVYYGTLYFPLIFKES